MIEAESSASPRAAANDARCSKSATCARTFATERRRVRARSTASSFALERGRTLGIVGESGCGKSVTALSIMGLVPQPPGRIAGGEILFEGARPARRSPGARCATCAATGIAMIFQEPMTSLNPVFTVGDQIAEALLRHREHRRAPRRSARAIEMLRRVRIPSPEQRVDDYPHQLSGGMRQRVMIAMALACEPQLLIADEPTTALDVTIQAQILELLRTLRDETGTAIILITHDLGVVAELADDVVVMYAGRIVERGAGRSAVRRAAASLHDRPARLDPAPATCEQDAARRDRGPGARRRCAARRAAASHPRCPFADRACRAEEPPLLRGRAGHRRHAGARRSTALPRAGSRPHERSAAAARSRGLVKHFPVRRGLFGRARGAVRAVDGVELRRSRAGETLALVGESGCGKSTLGPAGAAPDRADRGHGRASTGSDLVALDGARAARAAPRDADHLPGSVRARSIRA